LYIILLSDKTAKMSVQILPKKVWHTIGIANSVNRKTYKTNNKTITIKLDKS